MNVTLIIAPIASCIALSGSESDTNQNDFLVRPFQRLTEKDNKSSEQELPEQLHDFPVPANAESYTKLTQELNGATSKLIAGHGTSIQVHLQSKHMINRF